MNHSDFFSNLRIFSVPFQSFAFCCLGKSLNFSSYERFLSNLEFFFRKPYGASYLERFNLFRISIPSFRKFLRIFFLGSEYGWFRFSETSEDLLQAVESRFCCAFTDSIESGLSLEPFVVPYLRRFSFCDYTISRPQGSVHSQSRQRSQELFVQKQTGKYIDICGIMFLFGVCKNPPPMVLGGGFVVGSKILTSFRER